jgi:hypothetical protein
VTNLTENVISVKWSLFQNPFPRTAWVWILKTVLKARGIGILPMFWYERLPMAFPLKAP